MLGISSVHITALGLQCFLWNSWNRPRMNNLMCFRGQDPPRGYHTWVCAALSVGRDHHMTAASICYSMPGPSKLPAMLGVRITVWGCTIPYKPSDSLCYWPARPAGPARQPPQPAAPSQSCPSWAASRPAGLPATPPASAHILEMPFGATSDRATSMKCASEQTPFITVSGNAPAAS